MASDKRLVVSRRGFCGGLLSLPIAERIIGESSPIEFWNTADQAKRRSGIYSLHQEFVGPLFDESGRWVGKSNPPGTTSILGEEGRSRTVQKNNTVIVAYQSKGQFVGKYLGLRLTIAVPVIYRSIHRVLFNGELLRFPFRAAEPGIVALEDDYLYCTLSSR